MNNETKEIIFLVQGSNPEPYRVKFLKNDTFLAVYCTCPAGKNGMHCKHRINILMGLTDAIVSDNASEVKSIQKWLKGTPADEAIQSLISAEKEYLSAKKALTKAKKSLAKVFKGE